MGTGHTPSRSTPEYWVDCDIPWLTTADVHRFRHDELSTINETELHISEFGMANSAAVLHPAGTVALSRTASAGFSVVMGQPMATSQDYATWTCGPSLHNRYLLWCLRAMRSDLLGRLAMGSTHKTIYFPDLMGLRIPLPPIEEQRRIADFLDDQVACIESVVSARARQTHLLEARAQSRLGSRFASLASSCGLTPLRRFVDRIEQGSSPVAQGVAAVAGERGVIATSAIKSGAFLPENNKLLSSDSDFDPRFELRSGDVLVVRGSGSGDLVADACEVTLHESSPSLMLSDLTYRLAGLGLEPAFAVACLLTPQARAQIRALVRQGSGPAKARGDDVLSLSIPVAPRDRQVAFAAAHFEDRRELATEGKRILRSQELLGALKGSLISAAVSGELDVSTASGRGIPA